MIKGLDESDWNSLLRNIKQGECTPFIGSGACYKSLPQFSSTAQDWAAQHSYPLKDSNDLARVSQFLAIRRGRPMAPKEMIRDRLETEPGINFNTADEPHGILADLPLPVYITTNYDDCMQKALSRKRNPKRELCKWNESLANEKFPLSSGFVPSVEEPLVFHLYGHYARTKSLVLTEDDYMDFLVNISSGNYGLPPLIQDRLTETSLLFLGYQLMDWSFRVLLRSLIAHKPSDRRGISVTVQLPSDASIPDREDAQQYLEDYFKQQNLLVIWCSTGEFAQELGRRCKLAGIQVPERQAEPPPRKARVLSPANRQKLLKNMVDHLSIENLKTMCFELNVNYDVLPGGDLEAKARELILDREKNNRLEELVEACAQRRPEIDWQVLS